MDKYTPSEIKDIQDREKKALKMLAELELTPACQIYKQNIGNDIFVDKVQPYLADTRYVKKPTEENKESVETVSPGN